MVHTIEDIDSQNGSITVSSVKDRHSSSWRCVAFTLHFASMRFSSTIWLVVGITATGCAFAQTRRIFATRSRCAHPSIYIDKSDAVLQLRCSGVAHAQFEATFGASPGGPKLREGDERTPEGRYTIVSRIATPRFHRFLGVSYPNADDRARARREGITRLGGGIGIHGITRSRSWLSHAWIRVAHDTGLAATWGPTDGCIALDNRDIEYLYDRVTVGTPVEIVP
jgi:hypothetical protein